MLNILFCIFHALKYDSIVSTQHSFWGVWILFGCFLLGFHNKARLRVVTVCTLQFINCTRARASARNRRRWKAALNLHLKWSLTSSLIQLKTATRWVQNSGTTHVCTHARTRLCQYPDEVTRSGAGTPQVRRDCDTGQMSTFAKFSSNVDWCWRPAHRRGRACVTNLTEMSRVESKVASQWV